MGVCIRWFVVNFLNGITFGEEMSILFGGKIFIALIERIISSALCASSCMSASAASNLCF